MVWLQGGPFLEVSFILEEKQDTRTEIENIIDKLALSKYHIIINNTDIDELINEYVKGYSFDEDDHNSHQIHTLTLELNIKIKREGRALLFIEKIEDNTIHLNFVFYGSEDDAVEWNQIGILPEEYNEFNEFLIDLFRIYNFVIGGVAIEEDSTCFFNSNKGWPNDDYRFSNIKFDYIIDNCSSFNCILYNKKYGVVEYTNYEPQLIDNNEVIVLVP